MKALVGIRFAVLEAPEGMAVSDPEAVLVCGGEPSVIFLIRLDGEDAGGGVGSAFVEGFGDERASGFEAEGDESAGLRVCGDGEDVLELVDVRWGGASVPGWVRVP